MAVFVIDKQKTPLMPCTERRARILLQRKRAVVVCLYPFTIRLKDRIGGEMQPLRIKLDPGSKTTGMAVVRESETINTTTGEVTKQTAVLNLFEIAHRGNLIRDNLISRRAKRCRRRAQLRYRQARFLNRTRNKGWLTPSLQHRIDTTLSWVDFLRKVAPITALSQELVRFDMQQLENPEISGIEYQQGALQGYEVREYQLEKWQRTCAYCGKKDIPLQIEHIVPKSRGGSNRLSNLTVACSPCNQAKGNQPIEAFLAKKPETLQKILAQAKRPLHDAAAVNITRWALAQALEQPGLSLELASGGKTKFNRSEQSIPKTHALDAVCVGDAGIIVHWNPPTLEIRCTGRGCYQRTLSDAHGFPRGYRMQNKSVDGFQTGDMVKAVVTKGKKMGTYIGRVAVRASGNFNIRTKAGLVVQGIASKYCTLLSRNDGYGYAQRPKIAIP